ncbi:MAG: nucleotidyltransferase domain-containing protein [Verrucomicrobia bacterium]|nr:nucleotidyltransferase domain-containing protein [Verrucomicrobiota bacterium]
MPTLEIQPAHLLKVRAILAVNGPNAEVWAFGSRVNGHAHEGSDLDLVVRNPNRLLAPQSCLRDLRDALSESDLPFGVEVLDWAQIPEAFRREIERQDVEVTSPKHNGVE